MTVRERILAHLKAHPEGVDDDALAEALSLKQHRHANQVCRKLEGAGLIQRQWVNGKIRNFFFGNAESAADSTGGRANDRSQSLHIVRNSDKPWYWEGNVQAATVEYLRGRGYRIVKVADTASKEQGKDIIAVAPSGVELRVSAKGYPKGTARTRPATQARHWFKGALLDLAMWRGDDSTVALALAMPDFKTYRNLMKRVAWLLPTLRASILWVRENGTVENEEHSQ